MTSAPANLLAARRLLLDHLHIDPAALGIVGDAAHRGGYHCGSDRVLSEDYSVVESARDRTGLSDYACALDVGDFSVSVAGKRHTLPTFSMWLVAQCKANTADTRDIREVIYSPDGVVVRRWDRLGKRASGDSSHRWHTHISYHRDAVKAGRDQTAVMRRYLTTIGLIEGDDIMTPAQEAKLDLVVRALTRLDGREPIGQAYLRLAVGKDDAADAKPVEHPSLSSLGAQLAAMQAALTALAGRDLTDEPAIVAGVLAGLSPQAIAAAIPTDIAKQVAAELGARLAG